ncbi:DUF2867 domain-containing protein [Streptomyces sp. NPDC090022]|uniref:DUF2867 domain-containing protein n=1 Tax=Streptomyces sp. NPDC090022 TaxID=3365920 RepID=UPI00382434B3
MKVPDAEHTGRPWRIHELTRDFRLEDVWAIRTPGGGPDDFPAMCAAIHANGGPEQQPGPSRFLFAVRRTLGALLGWDRAEAGTAPRGRSLRERLPHDLRDATGGPVADGGPLTPVFSLGDESADELANKTVHAVMHLGWVPTDGGEHELRMAVLVKPHGLRGRLYLAAIRPLRHLIVYPALTRQWERAWRERDLPCPPAAGEAERGTGRGAGRGAGRAVERAVGTHQIPPSVLALGSVPVIDYADLFTLATDATATPERWARAMFGDVPTPGERLIWRGLLGMHLRRGPSPDTVAGWRIAGRGEDWIRLEAASWFLAGNLLISTPPGRVSLATFLHYRRPFGRVWWPPLAALHRSLAPGLLRDTDTALRAARR